jgi:hypothetical protein
MNSQLNELILRPARVDDAVALRRLAQLDSKVEAPSEAMLAEVDGDVVAAVPMDGGPAIADPFRWTADIVNLLRARAAQLR